MEIVVEVPEWIPKYVRTELKAEIDAAVSEAIMTVWCKHAPGAKTIR